MSLPDTRLLIGGFKQSGLGRERGRDGLEAFQETKHAHIETVLEVKDWWYPYGRDDDGDQHAM